MRQPDQTGISKVNNIENITFGIEIETTIPLSANVRVGGYHNGALATSARKQNGELVSFPAFQGMPWRTERDCSIMVLAPGHTPCEFVSPVLKGEAGIAHLIAFVEFLREIGAEVNPSCGMHIHVSATTAAGTEDHTAYLERLVRLVAFNSKALYAQTGTTSREKGRYCAPLGATTRDAIARVKKSKRVNDAAIGPSRYHILNLTNLARIGTVEFRCFAGTLNTNKVLLHLFSVLALCIVARTAKTPASWENKALSGTKALTNFLKVRPMTRIVGSPIMTARFPRMLAKALEMGAKYDSAQAADDLRELTSTNA